MVLVFVVVVLEELDFEEGMKRKLKEVKMMVMGDGGGIVVVRVEMVVMDREIEEVVMKMEDLYW